MHSVIFIQGKNWRGEDVVLTSPLFLSVEKKHYFCSVMITVIIRLECR